MYLNNDENVYTIREKDNAIKKDIIENRMYPVKLERYILKVKIHFIY